MFHPAIMAIGNPLEIQFSSGKSSIQGKLLITGGYISSKSRLCWSLTPPLFEETEIGANVRNISFVGKADLDT
jgi:hypothetical protein